MILNSSTISLSHGTRKNLEIELVHPGTLNSIDGRTKPPFIQPMSGDMNFDTAIRLLSDLYHACQRTKEATSLLPHHYKWICILGILSITKISDAALSSPDYPLQEPYLAGDLEKLEDQARPMTPGAEDDPDAGDAALLDSSSQTCCRVSRRTRWSWVQRCCSL